MSIIHKLLGAIILLIDWLTTPKSVSRSDHQQTAINEQAKALTLYQYRACPFCVKVRRSMKRHALPIETRDAKRSETAKHELVSGGGKLKVPCLKIIDSSGDVNWMYESKAIIRYLEERFTQAA
jgi:Glutathione S-transferase